MDNVRNRAVELARAWVDAVGYALVMTVLSGLVAVIAGIGTGGGFVRGKILLFVIGWLLMTAGTLKLWPSSPRSSDLPSRNVLGISLGSDDDDENSNDGEGNPRQLRESMQDGEAGGEDLRPLSAEKKSRVERIASAVPPNRWVRDPRPENRLTDGSKLFLASLFVFGLSYVMERYFGVV